MFESNPFTNYETYFQSNYQTENVNLVGSFPERTCYYGCSDKDGWGPISLKHADFTPCFLQGLVCTVVAVLTIGLAISQAIKLRKNFRKNRYSNRVTGYFFVKLGLIGLMFFIQLELILTLSRRDSVFVGHIADAVGLLFVLALLAIQHFTSPFSNGVVLFYWLWEISFNLARVYGLVLRDQFKKDENLLYNISCVFNLVLPCMILFAELYFPVIPLRLTSKRTAISPYDSANVFARISFSWMDNLMKKGYATYLTEDDLPPLPMEIEAGMTSTEFAKQWDSQISQHKRPTLFKAVAKAFGGEFALGGVFKIVMDLLGFIQPQLLRMLIRFVNEYSDDHESQPINKGFMIALAMFVVSASQTFFAHQYYQRAFDLGMKIKTALTSRIYAKSLILSNESRLKTSTGDIVNIMAVDVQRLQDLVQNVQMIWSGPFQIAICLISLYNLLGSLAWIALVVMLILIPVNASIARTQKKLQRVQMKNKDERSSLISEIINNIKTLKFYDWGGAYLEKLTYVRNEKELKNLKTIGIFSAISTFTANLSPFLVSCTTFGIFVLLGGKKNVLLTDIVFPALSLFNLLNLPLSVLPVAISNIIECQVSIKRITDFLTSNEIQKKAVIRLPRIEEIGRSSIKLSNASFKWTSSPEAPYALSGINMDFKKGSLDCIVGRVGSGKSAILQAILGDLHKSSGKVEVHGTIAYVSQVPWIMNGSVKENILFGHRFDSKWYQKVLNACSLNADLLQLADGDQTEVGEKGISLSGGQKARLALARAVYSGADNYIFDDTLSAVDEHVGKHLMDQVLGPSGILQSKCRILATNNIRVLGLSNCIHLVEGGKIVEQNSYLRAILNTTPSSLSKLIHEFGKKKREDRLTSGEESTAASSAISIVNDADEYTSRRGSIIETRLSDHYSDDEESDLGTHDIENLITNEEENSAMKSTKDNLRKEHVEQGEVLWDVYLAYVKACNPKGVLVFLSATVISMVLSVFSNVWLKHWSEINTKLGYNPQAGVYLFIYVLLGLGSSIFSLIQTCILWIYCTIEGSKTLHSNMALSVIRSPMSFFETTPTGRILNRFSNDIYKVDEQMGRVFGMFFTNLAKVLFTLIVICFSTWPFIFIIIPLCLFYYHTQQYYLRTSRELRRLDSVSRSPIFSNFQESLNGVSVIRAYGQTDRFKQHNRILIDTNMKAFNPAINANRWLAVRLEFLGSLIIFGASGLSVLSLKNGGMTAGLVGLSVSYALQITKALGTIVRMTVEVETNIVSVERILEYSCLTPEAPQIIENNRPATSWPESGAIVFENYLTRYRADLDYVLKDLKLSIAPKEKIGIVGRTGAGKSSITLALFRLLEAAEGDINIDGHDISKLGLSDLRSKLSIIPQDSQIFQGSVRTNLDPTSAHEDEYLWKVLKLAHLKDHILKMNDESPVPQQSALDIILSEGGSNLSAGQRQLMCLARALLVESTILVLDEATAAVDVETDQILQETIRVEFQDRTTLTIAHRLNTILNSDRIIVLDKGKVAEFDTPQNLLNNPNSLFYSLCEEGGFVNK